MNTNTSYLTDEGIMMREGFPLLSDVIVKYTIDEGRIGISYTDELGISCHDYRSALDEGITIMNDEDGLPNSILSENDNWYVFWNNYTTEVL